MWISEVVRRFSKGLQNLQFFVGYLGLMTKASSGGAELGDKGYARQPVCFRMSRKGRMSLHLSRRPIFGRAEKDWGYVSALALFTDADPSSRPLLSWDIVPEYVSDDQCFMPSDESLTLKISVCGLQATDNVVGRTAEGGDVVVGRSLMIEGGSIRLKTDTVDLSATTLKSMLTTLLRSLPDEDPGDGVSLWSNAGLLALSITTA